MNNNYATLDQLDSLFKEDGYMCYGHGTGRSDNSLEIVDKIFKNGLRTKDNSLYYTSIGLSIPNPLIKKSHEELGLPEPTMEKLKKTLDNWPHFASKKIIIVRFPVKYINMNGDHYDLDGEQFYAFYTEERNANGKIIYYVNPKYILGCYDAEKQLVLLNDRYEKVLSNETIKELEIGYQKALKKTNERLSRNSLPFFTRNDEINQDIIRQR